MENSLKDPLEDEITFLLEHLCRIIHGMGFTDGMAPVQWSALRYFARMGEAKRTMAGLANFSDVNISSASRTVAVLKRKGLLSDSGAPSGRRRNIELTVEGWEVLKKDPLRDLRTVTAGMSPADKTVLRRLIGDLLMRLCPKAFDEPETPRS